MKLILLRPCIVESEGHEPVTLYAGDTIDIADRWATHAIARGLAHPFVTLDDEQTGAPGREKSAMRRSPEIH